MLEGKPGHWIVCLFSWTSGTRRRCMWIPVLTSGPTAIDLEGIVAHSSTNFVQNLKYTRDPHPCQPVHCGSQGRWRVVLLLSGDLLIKEAPKLLWEQVLCIQNSFGPYWTPSHINIFILYWFIYKCSLHKRTSILRFRPTWRYLKSWLGLDRLLHRMIA